MDMRHQQRKLVGKLRADGRTHTAQRVEEMGEAAFINCLFDLAFRHAADLPAKQ